ncbi:putative quinol monooxygenase [Dyadobacter arcticus]|uniref:Quinol monooxygenase YgiN n=1 Tax=Dyadobacter arcticus TaxID=1078754 RepID=A0ABX0UI60_9BACT|nr:antibiotic biosynthesis monooxygenase [Dyadobacter arcticus]NIJ52631.1 quinol monooxygenase YgiN [Dyadobacter arcticus]
MTVEYIRYNITPEQIEVFIQSYEKASEQLDASEYCVAYELSECEEEVGQFILRIEWTSTKEHLNGFRKSKDFPEFFASIKPFFNDIMEMRHYKLTNVKRNKR